MMFNRNSLELGLNFSPNAFHTVFNQARALRSSLNMAADSRENCPSSGGDLKPLFLYGSNPSWNSLTITSAIIPSGDKTDTTVTFSRVPNLFIDYKDIVTFSLSHHQLDWYRKYHQQHLVPHNQLYSQSHNNWLTAIIMPHPLGRYSVRQEERVNGVKVPTYRYPSADYLQINQSVLLSGVSLLSWFNQNKYVRPPFFGVVTVTHKDKDMRLIMIQTEELVSAVEAHVPAKNLNFTKKVFTPFP